MVSLHFHFWNLTVERFYWFHWIVLIQRWCRMRIKGLKNRHNWKKKQTIFYRYFNTDNIFRDFISRTAIISSYWADLSPTGQNILFYLGMKLIKWRLLLQAFTNELGKILIQSPSESPQWEEILLKHAFMTHRSIAFSYIPHFKTRLISPHYYHPWFAGRRKRPIQTALKPDGFNNCQSSTSGACMLITPENTANWF